MGRGIRFTTEFKREAVRLVLSSGRPRTEIAEDLGVGLSSLTRWIGQYRGEEMPPDLRNHLEPTGGDTPASRAASSLERPVAIAAQNRTSSSRRAESGRPGECNLLRPDRSDRRLRTVIATSYARVLRRPIELAQYCSIDYQAVLRKHDLLISMSGKGNCYDNAVVETFFKTIKSELIWPVSWQTRSQAENAVARYIDGFYNPIRRHSTLGYQSPVHFEMAGRE